MFKHADTYLQEGLHWSVTSYTMQPIAAKVYVMVVLGKVVRVAATTPSESQHGLGLTE